MNKHKYRDAGGDHVIGGPLTGWTFADATRQIKCPKCKSDAGFNCETPKGRATNTPHGERVQAFQAFADAIGAVPGKVQSDTLDIVKEAFGIK